MDERAVSSKGASGAVATEWRSGWPVVLAATIGYGTGGVMLLMTAGLFIIPMRAALGSTTSAVTIAPIILLIWAFSSPVAGAAVDRFGSRRIAIFGAVALAITLLGMAIMPLGRVTLYAGAVALGFCGAFSSVAPYTKGVATWFRHSVGTAFGITQTGTSIVGLFAIPAAGAAIYHFGWRGGFVALAAITIVVGLPVILALFRERPSTNEVKLHVPEARGITARRAFADGRFWTLILALSLASFPLGGFMAHLQPLLAGAKFSVGKVAGMGVLYAASATIGRIFGGILLDRTWDYGIAAFLLTLAAGGGILLGNVDTVMPIALLALAVFLVGMGQGAEGDFAAYFSLKLFGIKAYSTILGPVAMASALGSAAGGLFYALLFDTYGDYQTACYVGAGVYLAAAIALAGLGLVEHLRSEKGRAPDLNAGTA